MNLSKIRRSIVAGKFYPAQAEEINRQIESFLVPGIKKSDALACMLPHAGYTYSGRVAALTVANINIKEKIILLGPNHTGRGPDYSMMAEGAWQTPLGELKIDSRLAKDILAGSRYLKDDSLAHSDEHSLEVELPILQYFKRDFEIIPIAFMSQDTAALKKIGEEIAGVIKASGLEDKVLFVASTDLTHYEPQKGAEKKDKLVIEAILALDVDQLTSVVRRFDISMCGYAPVTVMLSIINSLGASAAKLIKYQTSAEVTHDPSAVVGYAGIIFN